MQTFTVNELEFQPWTRWSDRLSLADDLLARFQQPPRTVDPRDDAIVYIGETVSQALSSRWYQFNRSAFEEKSGHSGGHTYRHVCGGQGRNLFVAALPVHRPEPHAGAYIRYVERLLIWEYCRRHGDLPCCNRK